MPSSIQPDLIQPEDCHCLAARRASRRLSRLYDRHLAAVGVNTAQFSLLGILNTNPGLTMTELGVLMAMDRTTVVRAVKPLQRDGLVDVAEGGGTRSLCLSISSDGARTLVAAGPFWRAAQAEFERDYGVDRALALRVELHAAADT